MFCGGWGEGWVVWSAVGLRCGGVVGLGQGGMGCSKVGGRGMSFVVWGGFALGVVGWVVGGVWRDGGWRR